MIGVEALLAVYIVAFAIVHSYTASTGFKERMSAHMDPQVYLFLYTVVSAVTTIPIVGMWLYYRWSAPLVYSVPFPFRWLSFAVMLLGAGIALASLIQTDPLDFLGVKAFLGLGTSGGKMLIRTGVYSLVRHPLYLGGILFFWANPVMTTVDLTGSAFATAYFLIGSRLEERKLMEEFGEEYAEYRREVSGFIPLKRLRKKSQII
ncbi:MAG: methyltransferase family protein [Candidatus Hydrothermarchaeaceae archaeon]